MSMELPMHTDLLALLPLTRKGIMGNSSHAPF